MTDFTENFAAMQKQGLEPVRKLTGVAVDAFEDIARKNLELYGEVLDLVVEQARLPVDVSEPKELFERQAATTKAFTDLFSTRFQDYVALGQSVQESATDVINSDLVEPVKQASSSATKGKSESATKKAA